MRKFLVIVLLLEGCCVVFAGEKDSADLVALSKEYANTKGHDDRRAFCIRLIDKGVIYQGMEIASIDQIFGTALAKDLPTPKEELKFSGIFFFHSRKISRTASMPLRHPVWGGIWESNTNREVAFAGTS